VIDLAPKARHTAGDFPLRNEVAANLPPYPCSTARHHQLAAQFTYDFRVVIGFQERQCQGEPLTVGGETDQVHQEGMEIISVAAECRERRLMHDFKINQPGAAGFGVIQQIPHRRIAV